MLRRETPDSEAVASSEDDGPWPHSTFGSRPRNENGVPGLGASIWAQSSRGSFKLDDARRMAVRQSIINSGNMPHPATRVADTPSPTTSDPKSLPFSIPLRPTPKAGRSLSHSQGQREMPASMHTHAGATDRSSTLPLDLVNEAEEIDTDSEPELGAALTQTASQPAMRHSNAHSTRMYEGIERFIYNRDRRNTNEGHGDGGFRDDLSNALDGLHLGDRNKPRWQTSSGWDELHTINESRRHSLAGEMPTRRGSMAAAHEQLQDVRAGLGVTDHRSYGSHDEAFSIPELYRVQPATIEPHERMEMQQPVNMHTPTRPRKDLYIVSFKCARAGVFYLLDNTGLTVQEGDMVIVEADRGQDLGTVLHAKITPEDARTYLQKYSEEQYKWLMMFSNNNQAGAVNPNANIYSENNSSDYGSRPNMPSTRPQKDQFQNLKPKAIKRMAADREVRLLKDKEGNEAKAKRCCQQKVVQHRLDMEILEAEFQWDWQKLIFYYYADHYVNFKELVNDLYKLYKVRLWMSAVNPASFSPNAINQPPTARGPGAMIADTFLPMGVDNSYNMAYGSDPDPYGAIPPYPIGYDTYVPNYPSIPGMPNSFAPVPGNGTPAQPAIGQWPDASGAVGSPATTATAYGTGSINTPIGSPLSSMTSRGGVSPAYMMQYSNPYIGVGRQNMISPMMMQGQMPARTPGTESAYGIDGKAAGGQRGSDNGVHHQQQGSEGGSREQLQQAMNQMAWASQNRHMLSYPVQATQNYRQQQNVGGQEPQSKNGKRGAFGGSNQSGQPGSRQW